MQTEKPKSKRGIIIVAIITIAVIAGGVASYFFFFHSVSAGNPDFKLFVKVGDPNYSSGWADPKATDTLLNGTSRSFVVGANATNGFRDIIQLSFTSPASGITATFTRTTLNPQTGGISVTGMNITANSNPAVRKQFYNLTVTGTASSLTRSVVFPLRIRETTLRLTPTSFSVAKSTTFKVGIAVSDIYNFQSFQFTLNYNSTLISAHNFTLNPIFYPPGTKVNGVSCDNYVDPRTGQNTPCNGFMVPPIINNSTGIVSIAASLLGQCGVTAPCVDSPGTQFYNFANVTFISNSTNAGKTQLTLTNTIMNELIGFLPVIEPYHNFNSTATVTTYPAIHVPASSGPSPSLYMWAFFPLVFAGIVCSSRRIRFRSRDR